MPGGPNAAPGPLTVAIAAIFRAAYLELLTTQKILGERLGIPQSTLSLYMRGEKVLDVETFVRLSRELGLDPVNVLDVALTARASERGTASP